MLLDKAGTALAAYPGASGAITLPSVTTVGEYAFGSSAITSVNLPAATAIGAYAFQNCAALASLTLGTTLPTLGGSVFYDAGRDTSEGFTIYVPTTEAKTAFDAVIDDTGSDWHKALKDTSYFGIYHGKFKEVKVTQ